MSLTGRKFWSEPDGVDRAAANVRERSRVVDGPADLDDLVERVADAECVLLGEATHGTSEFYRWRAQLSARLIREHDFDFVAVEGDWTSCYRANQFVRGDESGPETVRDLLGGFERWPTWMWANWEMAEFFEWLRLHNEEFEDDADRVGFYGLDVYGLFESLHAVLDYLEDEYPEHVEEVKEAFRCFEPYGEDAREYAKSTRMVPKTCEDEVVELLTSMRERAAERAVENAETHEEAFDLEQNALVAKNAEDYYRTMASGHGDSWNVRDEHMVETLGRLKDHHDGGKAIVWAHNTHVGDARATDMESKGRINIGQLAREEWGDDDTAVVGFGSHRGSVVAADAWGDPMEEMDLPAAKSGSYEDVFHAAGGEDRLLFTDDVADDDALAEPRGHRAVGVVYHPAAEGGNYVPTDLRERYDAFLHLDETTALHPVDLHAEREHVPELYPSGL
ncbi:erythromycin esterase family protein [Halospeciosus flavus]|uniref:Erythromycin esterase family protein n=1 Tax=Halospeciosus flavus TaxID=3032283 RepID=A0ABD5Z5X3_9EURY|nr:erythromycin esterase family protein [Halospeciosus flavus]